MRANRSKRILFVCTGNIDRSPTAEYLLKAIKGYSVLSAGTWEHAPRRISQRLLDWADIIFAMEHSHKEAIMKLKSDVENKIIVLDISDKYRKGDYELIKMLKAKLSKYLPL